MRSASLGVSRAAAARARNAPAESRVETLRGLGCNCMRAALASRGDDRLRDGARRRVRRPGGARLGACPPDCQALAAKAPMAPSCRARSSSRRRRLAPSIRTRGAPRACGRSSRIRASRRSKPWSSASNTPRRPRSSRRAVEGLAPDAPERAAWLYQLGKLKALGGNPTAAATAFEASAATGGPLADFARLSAARWLVGLGKNDEAMADAKLVGDDAALAGALDLVLADASIGKGDAAGSDSVSKALPRDAKSILRNGSRSRFVSRAFCANTRAMRTPRRSSPSRGAWKTSRRPEQAAAPRRSSNSRRSRRCPSTSESASRRRSPKSGSRAAGRSSRACRAKRRSPWSRRCSMRRRRHIRRARRARRSRRQSTARAPPPRRTQSFSAKRTSSRRMRTRAFERSPRRSKPTRAQSPLATRARTRPRRSSTRAARSRRPAARARRSSVMRRSSGSSRSTASPTTRV